MYAERQQSFDFSPELVERMALRIGRETLNLADIRKCADSLDLLWQHECNLFDLVPEQKYPNTKKGQRTWGELLSPCANDARAMCKAEGIAPSQADSLIAIGLVQMLAMFGKNLPKANLDEDLRGSEEKILQDAIFPFLVPTDKGTFFLKPGCKWLAFAPGSCLTSTDILTALKCKVEPLAQAFKTEQLNSKGELVYVAAKLADGRFEQAFQTLAKAQSIELLQAAKEKIAYAPDAMYKGRELRETHDSIPWLVSRIFDRVFVKHWQLKYADAKELMAHKLMFYSFLWQVKREVWVGSDADMASNKFMPILFSPAGGIGKSLFVKKLFAWLPETERATRSVQDLFEDRFSFSMLERKAIFLDELEFGDEQTTYSKFKMTLTSHKAEGRGMHSMRQAEVPVFASFIAASNYSAATIFSGQSEDKGIGRRLWQFELMGSRSWEGEIPPDLDFNDLPWTELWQSVNEGQETWPWVLHGIGHQLESMRANAMDAGWMDNYFVQMGIADHGADAGGIVSMPKICEMVLQKLKDSYRVSKSFEESKVRMHLAKYLDKMGIPWGRTETGIEGCWIGLEALDPKLKVGTSRLWGKLKTLTGAEFCSTKPQAPAVGQ